MAPLHRDTSTSGRSCGPTRHPATLLTLTLIAIAAALFLSACGGGKKESTQAKTTPATTQAKPTPTPGLSGAAGHFADAKAALAKGNLTGPEGVKDHLEEAITASVDLPQAKEHAEDALKALAKSDQAALAKEIDEGAAAARQAPVGTPKGTVKVSLGEFFVKPETSSIAAGTVEFKVTNDGKVAHEFVVIKTTLAPDKLPTRADGRANEEKAGQVPGEIEEFGPGKTQSLKLSLKPGKYVFICNLPGHYAAGQRTGFTVG